MMTTIRFERQKLQAVLVKHPVTVFFFLAYVISWTAAGLLQLIALQADVESFATLSRMAETTFNLHTLANDLIIPIPLIWLLTRVIDFGPTIAGLIMLALVDGKSGLQKTASEIIRWKVHPTWYLIAIGLPAILAGSAVGIFFILEGDINGGLAVPMRQIPVIFAGWIAIRFLIGGGLGEEVGWRGFALNQLLKQQGALRASIVIGLVWTFWHLPAHLVSDNLLVNLVAQLLITIPYTIIFTWIYLKSNRSLLIVALLHAASNAFIGVGIEQVFPVLNDEIGWILIYILLLNMIGIVFGFKLLRYTHISNTPC